MTKPVLTCCAAASACAALFAAPAQANLLANGSFESPVLAPASYLNITVGSEPAGFGWTVFDTGVDVFSNGVLGSGIVASAGTQALDLVGFGSTGGLRQSFATTAGTVYRLSFDYANNAISIGNASASVIVNDGAATLLSTSVSHNTSNTGNANWTAFSANFTGTGHVVTLSFDTTLGGGNGGILLDQVSVAVAPAVPEPGSYALMLAGLAVIVFVARRRVE